MLSSLEPVDAVLRRPHGLLEGPCFGPDGELVYSDVIAGGVWGCTPPGGAREIVPRRRGIGGIVPHLDGGWVVSGRSLLHVAADGAQRELLAGEPGVSGYNDIGVTREGTLLAGALRFRPFAGEVPTPGALLEIDGEGAVTVLNEEVLWPNGVAVSADGETIYLSDYAAARVLAIPRRGGRGDELARSPRGSADGLAIDAEGAIWLALGEGAGIARLLCDGRLDRVFDVPASFVSSLCFGGQDMRDVLITTADNRVDPELGGTLFRARSEVPGLPLTPVRV